MKQDRKLPRPFDMHWGNGDIIEEASARYEHSEAAIQLLEYTDPEHAGYLTIRFAHYSPDGRFQRSPLMVGADGIADLRKALDSTPKLRALLKKLVG
ncbi:MAG: hypothetical protein WD359_09730 [Dehalococcoidia bacterium]